MNHQTTSTPLLKRTAHKGLRGLLVFAQVISTLGTTIASLTQPAALVPLLGEPNVARADINPGGTTATQIIGTVFQDFNSNGVLSTTVTTTDGRYLFDNLAPGDYYIVFTLPSFGAGSGGYTFTQQSAGTPGTDSNANPVTGQSTPTTLEASKDDWSWDAGIWYPLPTLHLKKTLKTQNAAGQVGNFITYTVVVSNSGPGSVVPAAQFANNTLRWTKATSFGRGWS